MPETIFLDFLRRSDTEFLSESEQKEELMAMTPNVLFLQSTPITTGHDTFYGIL